MTVRYYSSVAAETTLVGTINSGATAIQLASVVGLPALTPYTLALDYEGVSEELVQVTAAAGTNLTVVRAIDGTSATSHNTGARVRHVTSARDFSDSRNHENSTTAVHGLAPGEPVVGTTSAQTLSNKTLDEATGTLMDIDIFAGPAWVTTVTGDNAGTVELMKWYQDSADSHEVTAVSHDGALRVRNLDATADSSTSTYRLRVTKSNGTQDIFSVLSGGSVVAWTDVNQPGFVVKPRGSNTAKAFNVRNTADSADIFAVYHDGSTDIIGQDPSKSQLDVFGAAAQATFYFRVMTSAAASVFNIDQTNKTTVNGTLDVRNDNNTGGVSQPVLTVHGRQTGQTGDLQQWFDGNGVEVASLDVNGNFSSALTTPSGSITAASGFTIVTTNAKIKGGIAYVMVVFERTGSTITAGGDGNIGDIDAFTVPAAMRPNSTYGGQSLPFTITDGFGGGWGRITPTTGVFEMVAWVSTGTIQSGRNLRVFMSYPV